MSEQDEEIARLHAQISLRQDKEIAELKAQIEERKHALLLRSEQSKPQPKPMRVRDSHTSYLDGCEPCGHKRAVIALSALTPGQLLALAIKRGIILGA